MEMYNSGLDVKTKIEHLKKIAEYRDKILRPEPYLQSLFLELTPFCNEHCLHCGSRCGDIEAKNMLSVSEYKTILDQVSQDFDISEINLCITGGEPLLRPEFFEIMSYANDKGYLWGMTSNGTLITKDIAKKLKEVGMQTIAVSVDGLKEKHEWFRRSPGSYEKTINGVKNLVAEKFLHVQITTVIHHQNIDDLSAMYNEFIRLGIDSWRVINIEPIGRAMENKELMLTKEDYKKLFSFIDERRYARPMEVCFGCSHYLGPEKEMELRNWYFLCGAGVHVASITYDGNIQACLDIERRLELIEGNIRTSRFKDIWTNGFKIYRSDYRKTGKCQNCPDYEFCAGDSFHTWNFDKMGPNLCMKEILDF